MFAEVGKEEPHKGSSHPSLNLKIGIELEFSAFVLGPVDVEQSASLGESFDG